MNCLHRTSNIVFGRRIQANIITRVANSFKKQGGSSNVRAAQNDQANAKIQTPASIKHKNVSFVLDATYEIAGLGKPRWVHFSPINYMRREIEGNRIR